MTTVLRLAVAAVLVLAAAAKIRDFRAVSARLGKPTTVALIAVEATLGAWLASGIAVRAAAGAATVLFVALALRLGLERARGALETPCSCFGAGPERPTSLLVARALALAGVSAIVVAGPPTPGRDTLLVTAVAVLAIAVAVLAVLVLALYRQVGVLTLRLGPRHALELAEEGPELGAPAPALAGLVRDGDELVAFLGVGCRVCHDLEPSLRALAREGLALRLVYDTDEPDAADRWGVPGTPFVCALVDGTVAAKGTVNTLEEIEGVLALGRARVAHATA